MDKAAFAERLVGALDGEEWKKLEDGTLGVPVSGHNRKVLLELRDTDAEFEGEVDDECADALSAALYEYLRETWPEQPGAHKYVVCACLVLTFVWEKPMHPQEDVKYFTRVSEGKAEYFCPAKTDSKICSFCAAERCERLYGDWERKTAGTAARHGELSARIQRDLLEAGFLDSGVLKTQGLRYHDDVRKLCEDNKCGAYGTTWACPPAVGTLDECRKRVESFSEMQLFSRAYLLADEFDFAAMKKAMHDFKERVAELETRLEPYLGSFTIMSSESCDRCKKCTYPDAPCRFPEKLHHSLEGYGFYVSELAAQVGMRYINGRSTVTFFGAVLYNDREGGAA